MKLNLLGNLVAIECNDEIKRPALSKTIIVADDGVDDFLFGKVAYVGPGDPPPAAASATVKPVPLDVKPGDKVLFYAKARAQTLRWGGKEFQVISADDIGAVVGD